MTQRGGRAVFGLNASVSVALVVLVATIALVVNPPSPPGIAAFAPQASKPITKAPPGQSSVNGSGSGSCAQGQVCAGAHPSARPSSSAAATARPSAAPNVSASAPPVLGGVPSSLQCYTWPDGSVTQTDDPQSPPCVAAWPGAAKGNGGATSAGVSGTEIRVAIPQNTSGSVIAAFQDIVSFFNTHYELYGRKLVLQGFPSQQIPTCNGSSGFENPQSQRADALTAASLKVFAATGFDDNGQQCSALTTYLDTLAQNHVVSVSGGTDSPRTTAAKMAEHAPYEWSYSATTDELMQAVASEACQTLVGHDAVHSGSFKDKTRTWAVVLPSATDTGEPLPGVDTLLSTLKTCGVSNPPVVYFQKATGPSSENVSVMAKLKSEGITSILYYPFYENNPGSPQESADDVNYDPEWITMGWDSLALGGLAGGSKGQLGHTFGVAQWNKLFPLTQLPWVEAYIDGGGDASQAGGFNYANSFYHEMLMLASGAQMAGPHLTPTSFSNALHSTSFPNPGAGHAPFYQGRVGFADGGHSMVEDYAGFWMDGHQNAASVALTVETQATDFYNYFCYVDLGLRNGPMSWPAQDRFFEGGCR